MTNNQNEKMAAFIEWLPQNIQKFEGEIPDEIINTIANSETPEETVSVLNELSASEEGTQLVSTLFEAFQNMQQGLFKEGGKLSEGLKRFQKGGYVQEPIKGNWDDYHTIIKAPGDTLRAKQYPSKVSQMQTYPNGNVRYTDITRYGTDHHWSPESAPSFMQRLLYGNRTANPELVQNWRQLIYNHANDKNVKDLSR